MLNKLYRITGINASRVVERYAEHSGKTGRSAKYNPDDRLFYSRIIELLVRRNTSETQAMKFLMKLIGEDKMSPDGFMKEMRVT